MVAPDCWLGSSTDLSQVSRTIHNQQVPVGIYLPYPTLTLIKSYIDMGFLPNARIVVKFHHKRLTKPIAIQTEYPPNRRYSCLRIPLQLIIECRQLLQYLSHPVMDTIHLFEDSRRLFHSDFDGVLQRIEITVDSLHHVRLYLAQTSNGCVRGVGVLY